MRFLLVALLCALSYAQTDLDEEIKLEMTVEGAKTANMQSICDAVAAQLSGVCTYVTLTGPSQTRRRLTGISIYMDFAVEDASAAVATASNSSFASSLSMPTGTSATAVSNVASSEGLTETNHAVLARNTPFGCEEANIPIYCDTVIDEYMETWGYSDSIMCDLSNPSEEIVEEADPNGPGGVCLITTQIGLMSEGDAKGPFSWIGSIGSATIRIAQPCLHETSWDAFRNASSALNATR